MLPALIYLPLLAPSRFAHPHPTLVFTRATFLYPPILLVLRSSRYRPQCYTDFQIAGFVVVGTLLLQIWFMTAAAICSKLFSVSDDRPSAVSDVLKQCQVHQIGLRLARARWRKLCVWKISLRRVLQYMT